MALSYDYRNVVGGTGGLGCIFCLFCFMDFVSIRFSHFFPQASINKVGQWGANVVLSFLGLSFPLSFVLNPHSTLISSLTNENRKLNQ